MNYQPSGIIPGGCALLTLAIVIFTALGVRVYDAASNYMQTPANTNTNANTNTYTSAAQVTPSRYPANTVSNYNSYANANTISSNANSIYYGNISNTETVSNNAVMNANAATTSNSKFYTNGRAIKNNSALFQEADFNSKVLENFYLNEEIKINYRQNNASVWFNVTTKAGKTGWMHGNDIEYMDIEE